MNCRFVYYNLGTNNIRLEFLLPYDNIHIIYRLKRKFKPWHLSSTLYEKLYDFYL